MHEMSIAVDLVRQLEALAAEHGASRIESIELEVGVLRLVVPEAMQEAFTVLAASTVAEGAELTIIETAATAQCGLCGQAYSVSVEDYLCPQCQQATATITSGNDIIIKSLICSTEGSENADED